MTNMGSELVLVDKRSLLLHLPRSHQMCDVVDERGTRAWLSPTVHCLCSGVCKTEPPGEKGVCASQALRGSQALPGSLRHLWELTHSPRWQGKAEEQKEAVAGRGAAAA